jgi:hypothetical protein
MVWYHGDVTRALIDARQCDLRRTVAPRPEPGRRIVSRVVPARRRAVLAR